MIEIVPANLDQVEAIYQLINEYYHRKIVLNRSLENISQNLKHFIVARLKDQSSKKPIIGCSSFHVYSRHLVEIRSLCVDPTYQKQGIGRRLVEEQIQIAHQSNMIRLFTLTLEENFFKKIGFTSIPKEQLPAKIFKDCLFCYQRKNCFEKALIYQLNEQ